MYQRIKASYIDDDFELKPEEIEKRNVWEKIYALRMDNKYSRHQTLKKIMHEWKVPRATAYRDYAFSMAIFGDVDKLDKAIERLVLAERYQDISERARKKGNLEAEIKALQAYEKILGVDKDESLADLLKYKSVDITLRISPKQKKAVDRFFNLGVADFNDFEAEDVDYDEVTDEEDEDDDDN
jgi:hypothetical protein